MTYEEILAEWIADGNDPNDFVRTVKPSLEAIAKLIESIDEEDDVF